jgi:RNA polymerase sigma-70 factor (ECF subfamily)
VSSDYQRVECPDFEQLLRAAHGGDREALGHVLGLFRRVLLHAAQRDLPADLRSKSGASDLIQETFLDAHRDFARFTGTTREELHAWLRCLLRHNFANLLRDYRTRQKRQVRRERPLGESDEPNPGCGGRPVREVVTPSEAAIRRESAERWRRAAGRLEGPRHEVFRMRCDERLSYEEIGLRLEMSPEAARKLFGRALRQVTDALGD